MLKNEHLITHGIELPLQSVKFHEQAPLKRILMSGLGASDFNMHIAIHEITEDLISEHRKYSKKHKHNCDEWNIILGSEDLTFEIILDDEIYEVKSPATVFIPTGTVHSANVLRGKGYYIAIVDTLDYDNSFVE